MTFILNAKAHSPFVKDRIKNLEVEYDELYVDTNNITYNFRVDTFYSDGFVPVLFVNRTIDLKVTTKKVNTFNRLLTDVENEAFGSYIWKYQNTILGLGKRISDRIAYTNSDLKHTDSYPPIKLRFQLDRSLLPIVDVRATYVSKRLSVSDIMNKTIDKFNELISNFVISKIEFLPHPFNDVEASYFTKSYRNDLVVTLYDILNLCIQDYKPIDLSLLSYIAQQEDELTLYLIPLTIDNIDSNSDFPVLTNIFVDQNISLTENEYSSKIYDDVIEILESNASQHTKQKAIAIFNRGLQQPDANTQRRTDVVDTDGNCLSVMENISNESCSMFDYKQMTESQLKLNTSVTRNSKLIKFNNNDVIMVYNDQYSNKLDLDFDFPFLCRYSEFYLQPESNSTTIRIANLVIPFNLTIGLENILDVDPTPSTTQSPSDDEQEEPELEQRLNEIGLVDILKKIIPQLFNNGLCERVEQGLEQRLNEYMQANNLKEKRVIKYYRVLPSDLDNIIVIVNVLERSLVLANQLAKPDEEQTYTSRIEQLLNEIKSNIAPITNITPINFSNLIKNSHSILSDLLRKDFYYPDMPEQLSIIFTFLGDLDNINKQLRSLTNLIKNGPGSGQNILGMLDQFSATINNILGLSAYLPDSINKEILQNSIDDFLTNLNFMTGSINKIASSYTTASMITNRFESIMHSIRRKKRFV